MDPLFSLEGRTALVTGGSRGIGRMIAAAFVARGARVYVSSRKADACRTTADALSAGGGACTALPQDVSTVEAAAPWPPPTASARRRSTSWSTTPARLGRRVRQFPRERVG